MDPALELEVGKKKRIKVEVVVLGTTHRSRQQIGLLILKSRCLRLKCAKPKTVELFHLGVNKH